MKPIITSIQEFLETSPYLDDSQVQIEGLESPMKCSVEPASGVTVYKQYMDGSLMKQYPFTISSADAYDANGRKLILMNGFWQYMEEWLEKQNADGSYPVMEDHIPIRVETMESGFVFQDGTANAKYQMKCRLIYE